MKIYNAIRKKRIFYFSSFLWGQADSLIDSASSRPTNTLSFLSLKSCGAKMFPLIFSVFFCLIVSVPSAQAATLIVNNIFDTFDGVCSSNYGCSLRDAIAEASNGDTITFSDDFLGELTTFLILGEIVIDKNLIIDGNIDDDPYPDVTISGNNNSRVFSIPTGIIATLEGLEIINGETEESNSGAGVYIADGNIILIQQCKFSSNNSHALGGAIYNGNGNLFVQNSTFSMNSSAHGGAIYNNRGILNVNQSRFEYNLATETGGAINNFSGVLNVIDSSIADNQAGSAGGILSNTAEMTIDKCRIINNDATLSDGGAVYCSGITTIRNSSFAINDALGSGGGIFGSGRLIIENSTFVQNTAFAYGGGIDLHSTSSLTIRNTTLYYNSAGSSGTGGLRIHYATGTDGEHMINTIIASSSGGDCHLVNGDLETNVNNLIEDGSCSPHISGDPKLGDYAYNGGDSWTVALQCNSPAIDAGDNAHVPATMSNDQRGEGFPRILDGDGNGTAIVDIGAYELDPTSDCRKNSIGGVLYMLLGEND